VEKVKQFFTVFIKEKSKIIDEDARRDFNCL
jgi:hypothetical protein